MPELIPVDHDPFDAGGIEYTPRGIPRITVTPDRGAPQGTPEGAPQIAPEPLQIAPDNPPVQPSQTFMGGLRAFMPNVASIASGEAPPPMENLPEQGKVPEIGDPRYQRAAGEIAEQGVGMVGPPMKAAAGAVAAGAAKFAPAILAGPMARTAPRAALREAERMFGAGVEEAGVTRVTGVSKGATDPGLRWEINDQPAKIRTGPKQVAAAIDPETKTWKPGTRLEDVLDHPELFQAYPELRRAVVKDVERGSGNRGSYDPSTGVFQLDARLPPNEQIKTVLHESQHHAQTREGFPGGGWSGHPATQEAAETALESHFAKANEIVDKYMNEHSKFLRERIRAGDRRPAAVIGGDFQRMIGPERSAQVDYAYKVIGDPANTRRAAAHAAYKHIAGEVEARNVVLRRNMSPEKRREFGPRVTEDYPPEHQIRVEPYDPASGLTADEHAIDQALTHIAESLTGGSVERAGARAAEASGRRGAQAAERGAAGRAEGVAETPRTGTLARWAGLSHDPGTPPDVAEAYQRAADAAGGHEPLKGLPDAPMSVGGETYVPGPIGYIHDAAEQYMKEAGLPYQPVHTYAAVDKKRAARIAEEYDAMEHAPNDPAVKASYDAMAKETVAQFRAIENAGIKFEFIKPGMDDPYAESPRLGQMDVEQNKHLWVFPSESGFGTENLISDNPLLQPSGVFIEGRELPYNDVFRIVHDIYGHHKEGNGFRAAGEENAWRSHSAMYSDLARPAMTSETRGQNSWVNYGPHGDANRTASAADTVFADQKVGLLPPWVMEEGRRDPPLATTQPGGAAPVSAPRQIAPFPSGPESATFVNLMDHIPGLKGVAKHLTPEEKDKVNKRSAQTLVDMFTKLPSAEEMAAVAYSGRAKKGWYRDSAEALVNIFGAADAPRFAALLAALSPQTKVEDNAINALTMWKNWEKEGRPRDAATVSRILGESVQGSGTESSVMGAWKPNVLRALITDDPTKVNLSGPKVNSFMLNLRDNVHEVTNDAWMATYSHLDQDLIGGQKKIQPNEYSKTFREKSPGYMAMTARVRQAADVLSAKTGEKWTPAEIQETIWSWAKTLYEKASSGKESGGADATSEQLLKASGLTHEEIASTPDFARLFVSGMYRRVLEEAGLGPGIERAEKSLAQRGAGVHGAAHGSPTSAQGSGFAGPAFEEHLHRAAKRLDTVRAGREEARTR